MSEEKKKTTKAKAAPNKRTVAKKTTVKKKMGRPTVFSEEIAQEICTRIAQGESVRTICEDPTMPAQSTVYLWLYKNKDFSEHYVHAREAQADYLMDEILDIADTAVPETVNVAKLRIDARKFYTGKVAPKKYGEKITQEVTGADGGPVEVANTYNMEVLSDEELRSIISIANKASSTDTSET